MSDVLDRAPGPAVMEMGCCPYGGEGWSMRYCAWDTDSKAARVSDDETGLADSRPPDEDLGADAADAADAVLTAATSSGPNRQWVAGRLVWWGSTLTITSLVVAGIGGITSPGAWWEEGPFSGAPCWELTLQHGADRWDVVPWLAVPLSLGAVLLGMLSRWQQARFCGLRAVAFPRHRRTAIGFAVVIATGFVARAVLDASLRRLAGSEYSACVGALWPGVVAWVLVPVSFAGLFALGTRALDYE